MPYLRRLLNHLTKWCDRLQLNEAVLQSGTFFPQETANRFSMPLECKTIERKQDGTERGMTSEDIFTRQHFCVQAPQK